MNYRSLRDFLEDLRSSDDLEILEAGVDPVDEAARVARKIADESGKAVLLRSVKGHDLPVAVNLFGSERRICRALGVECLERLAERVCEQMSPRQSGLLDNLLGAAQGDSVAGINPRIVRSAPCQQIVRLGGDVDLAFLPLLRATPAENSSWIPAAPVIARSPDSQQAMSGRFDVQLVDGHRLAVCFAEYDDLARHWQNSRQRNEKLPLAIVFGGEPAFMLASAAVLPGKIDACALAGLFRDKPLDVVSCRSVELTVPAEAEIVLDAVATGRNDRAATGARHAGNGDYASGKSGLSGDFLRQTAARTEHGRPGDEANLSACDSGGVRGPRRLRTARIRRRAPLGDALDQKILRRTGAAHGPRGSRASTVLVRQMARRGR
jgi:4-hydroxy-3-polyprenylbenzoate decarboxylase